MRLQRLLFLLGAVYFVFIGGNVYGQQILALKVAHHALLTVGFGAWLAWRLWRGRGLPATPLNVGIAGLCLAWLVSLPFSLDPRMVLENTWSPFMLLLVFWLLAEVFTRGRAGLVFEAQFMIAALVVILALVMFSSQYFGWGFLGGARIGWFNLFDLAPLPLRIPALTLPFGVSTWVAAYTAPLIVITGAWAWTARRRDLRIALFVLCGGLAFVLLYTQSRGGLVSLAAGVLTWAVLRLASEDRLKDFILRRRLIVGAVVGIGVFVVTAALVIMSRSGARSAGDLLRFDLWRGAAQITADHPITGVGVGMFGRAIREYRAPTNVDDRLSTAHNTPLNWAAELGVLGMAAYTALGVLFIRAWLTRRREANPAEKFRLDAAFAALVGFGVQSLFDTYTLPGMLTLPLLLAAYCVVQPHTALDIPRGNRLAGGIVLGVVALAGIGWWAVSDPAALLFAQSVRERSLSAAQAAQVLDPSLRLYALQVGYLQAAEQSAPEDQTVIYERLLALEPTWETGYLNLAAAYEASGDLDAALTALERALTINANGAAALHWARIAEATGAADAEMIISRYVGVMFNTAALPLAAFWLETPLRRAALDQYRDAQRIDLRYRITAAHNTEQLPELLPPINHDAADWWVTGEYALSVLGEPEQARVAFTQAIALDRANGDYYVSRARATWQTDPDSARCDLDMATLLGTKYEYPNAVRAWLAETPDEAQRWRAQGLPPRVIDQNFEGVLFGGRVGSFEVVPLMRMVGPGRAVMQPYYDYAAAALAAGDSAAAENAYRAILAYAPDEQEAAERLEMLLLGREIS